MGNCHVVGPNEVMVISGGCTNGKQKVIGGCGWAWWGISDVQKLSLNVMTLLPKCDNVETKQGVALSVNAVAQVMMMAEDHMAERTGDAQTDRQTRDTFLDKALEQFLGKTQRQVEDTILQTLEGHLRSILGTLTVEEIYRDREKFAHLVRDVAAADVAKMGLEILSFTIKDVSDRVEYLNSLGKHQIANVVRDADVGKAEASKDAGIRQAECERDRLNVKYEADTNIANSERQYQMQKATFDQEVNQALAEAELAYTLEKAKLEQEIRREQVEVQVVETRREIEVQEQEVLRKEKELLATVHRPAEAERFKVETLAEAKRTTRVLEATGEAEGIKAIGSAEAFTIKLKGEAEANAMSARAAAYKDYGDAALMSLILEALPKIAAEVAAPLARTKDIVLVSGNEGNLVSDISKLVSQLPPAMQALTGIELASALKKVIGQPTPASN